MSPKKQSPVKRRSVVLASARLQTGGGVHKDRRLPRGGDQNISRDLLDEYLEELRETEESL